MATSNLYNREIRASKSPRNAFDMSYSTLMSAPVGMLLPAYVEDVKRGDKLKLGLTHIVRSRPVNTSAFMAFDEKIDFYFVPYEALWSAYDQWRIMQTFRRTTTDMTMAGAQNYLPFTTWSSLAAFFRYLTPQSSSLPAHSVAFSPNVAHTLRMMDLLGYGVPYLDGIMASVNAYSGYVPNSSDNIVSKIAAFYDSFDDNFGFRINYFRLAAFQCIYQHHYRNEEYEPLDPTYYNLDNLFATLSADNTVTEPSSKQISTNYYLVTRSAQGITPLLNRIDWYKLFTPRFKNWRKDIFTDLKPASGFSRGLGFELSSSVGVTGGNPVTWGSSFLPSIDTNNSGAVQGNNGSSGELFYPDFANENPESTYNDFTFDYYNRDAANNLGANPALTYHRLFANLFGSDNNPASSTNPAVKGLAYLYPQNIRLMMSQDRFTRSAIYADKNYRDQIKALFGDDIQPDYHHPEYLGSWSYSISISDVTATSAGSDGDTTDVATSILGEIAGKVYSSDTKGDIFDRKFDHDGVVMGIHYIMPRNNYDSYRINPFNTKLSRWDYFSPQFDGLGYSPVWAFERNLTNESFGDQIIGSSLLGFAPRYHEYKQRTNEVHGSFMSMQPDYDWTLTNNADPVVTGSDPYCFKILPDITDRIFAVSWNGSPATDPFYCYFDYHVTKVSDMEVYGTPSI